MNVGHIQNGNLVYCKAFGPIWELESFVLQWEHNRIPQRSTHWTLIWLSDNPTRQLKEHETYRVYIERTEKIISWHFRASCWNQLVRRHYCNHRKKMQYIFTFLRSYHVRTGQLDFESRVVFVFSQRISQRPLIGNTADVSWLYISDSCCGTVNKKKNPNQPRRATRPWYCIYI